MKMYSNNHQLLYFIKDIIIVLEMYSKKFRLYSYVEKLFKWLLLKTIQII